MRALAIILLGSVALAQTPAPVSRGDLLKVRQYQTSGDLSMFVDPLGNDGNACTGTTTAACLTIQGAINKVPKNIQNAVTITIAAGTYAGFQVTGFTFRYPVNSAAAGSYLLIQGSYVTASPATGTATGTATAGTAGTTSPAVFGTLTDSGQAWTINNLQNKWIEITAGTGVGQVRPISSNTATVITVVGTWTAPVGASTVYAIRDQGTIINTALVTPNSPAITFTTGASVWAYDNANDSFNANGTNLEIKRIWAQPTTTSAGFAVAGGNRTYLREIQATTNGTAIPINFFGDNLSAVVTEAILLPTTGNGIIVPNLQRAGSVVIVRRTRISGGTTNIAIFGSLPNASFTQNELTGSTVAAVGMSAGSANSFSCLGCDGNIITCNGGPGIDSGSAAGRPFFWSGSGTSISNCTTAVLLSGGAMFRMAGTWTGTGNTTAFNVSTGSDLQISSASTLTGTTEINIDGDIYTLAELRALTPIAIGTQPYGSVVRQ